MRIQKYLLELQYRSFLTLFHLCFLAVFFFFNREEILYLLSDFQNDQSFQTENEIHFFASNLTEMFSIFFQLSLFLGLYYSIPFFLCQVSIFLRPAVYKYENRILQHYIKFSIFLFFISTFFSKTFVIPYCWEFFISFQPSACGLSIEFEAQLSNACHFFFKTLFLSQLFCQLLGFLVFFFPLIKPSFYIISRKVLYFFFLLFSTILTPPDIISQLLVTILFAFLYELFVFFFLLANEYKRANNGT